MIRKLPLLTLLLLLPLQDGCGTIVGNPKKPPPNNENINPIVYSLPLIDFSVPESAVSETESEAAGLYLNQSEPDDPSASQKTILISWAKRFDRAIKSINHLSERINRIIESERTTNKENVLVFKGKGSDNKLGAKIRPLEEGDTYQYEAVLCHGESPVSHIRWTADGTKMEVTRDFAPSVEQSEITAELTSRLTLEKAEDETLTIDLMSYGKAAGDLPEESGGFVEHAVVQRKPTAEITVKSVADIFSEQPVNQEFNGSYYLTGRMLPDPETGGKPFDQQFVAYYSGYKVLCKNGFDEESQYIWQPVVAEPRFCLGRPSGKKKFDSFEEFAQTVASLQDVGIVSKKTLAPVTISNELSCE